jgi:hypothetical protein
MAIMSPSIRRSGRVEDRSATVDRQKIAFHSLRVCRRGGVARGVLKRRIDDDPFWRVMPIRRGKYGLFCEIRVLAAFSHKSSLEHKDVWTSIRLYSEA